MNILWIIIKFHIHEVTKYNQSPIANRWLKALSNDMLTFKRSLSKYLICKEYCHGKIISNKESKKQTNKKIQLLCPGPQWWLMYYPFINFKSIFKYFSCYEFSYFLQSHEALFWYQGGFIYLTFSFKCKLFLIMNSLTTDANFHKHSQWLT